MRTHILVAAAVMFSLVASSAAASEGQGFGRCMEGFSDDTRVRTKSRGEMTISEVRNNDQVWSLNQVIDKPGWSRVLRRSEGRGSYRLFVDFTEPESGWTAKACWLIRRTS